VAQEKAVEVTSDIPKSGYIQWNQEECIQCSRCLMACAVLGSQPGAGC